MQYSQLQVQAYELQNDDYINGTKCFNLTPNGLKHFDLAPTPLCIPTITLPQSHPSPTNECSPVLLLNIGY